MPVAVTNGNMPQSQLYYAGSRTVTYGNMLPPKSLIMQVPYCYQWQHATPSVSSYAGSHTVTSGDMLSLSPSKIMRVPITVTNANMLSHSLSFS